MVWCQRELVLYLVEWKTCFTPCSMNYKTIGHYEFEKSTSVCVLETSFFCFKLLAYTCQNASHHATGGSKWVRGCLKVICHMLQWASPSTKSWNKHTDSMSDVYNGILCNAWPPQTCACMHTHTHMCVCAKEGGGQLMSRKIWKGIISHKVSGATVLIHISNYN